MRRRSTSARRFSAFVDRAEIHLIEYQRVRDRIDILNRTDFQDDFRTAADAAEALGRMLREQQAECSKVSITVRGLGSAHHILVLPQAKPELLRPVVVREMQRLYPDLENPLVGFTSGEPLDRRARARPDAGTPPQELLAAAMPRAGMDDFINVLARDDIAIEHMTVLPRVMQRVYAEDPSRSAPTVVVMLLRGGPIFGFFFDGELRLVVEPPAEGDLGHISPDFLIEQLERGNLYLRQQFRGAQISRLLLAAEPEEYGPLSRAVEERMGLIVERFGTQIGSSSAIAAMGAVLDSEDGSGLNLSPLGVTKKKTVEKTTRRIAIASCVMLAAIAWWWAGNGVAAVLNWRSRIDTLTVALERRAAPLQPLREIAVKRQQAAGQIAAIQQVAAERAKLQQLLQGLSLAPEAGVAIDAFHAQRDAVGWNATVAGSAASYTASDAVSSVHRFYRELPQFVGANSIKLDNLTWGDSVAARAGVTRMAFNLSYTAPPATGAANPVIAPQ